MALVSLWSKLSLKWKQSLDTWAVVSSVYDVKLLAEGKKVRWIVRRGHIVLLLALVLLVGGILIGCGPAKGTLNLTPEG